MRDHEQHISDEELLLAADGELGQSASCVRTHLEGCVHCRTKAAQMENALVNLARAERNSLDAELPSIAEPRAMLRTRMVELSRRKPSFFSGYRIFDGFPAWTLRMAALTAVLVVACVLVLRHSAVPGRVFSIFSSDRGILPNRALTPGVARQVSLEQLCSLPHEEVIKDVSQAERERVFAEYGIPSAKSDQYEVDYLITPGLGGDDDIRNLWPEPYYTATWNAHVKDVLEERLHEMVCSHQLDLAVAQKAIATNWIAAYRRYVQPSTSKTPTDGMSSRKTTVRSVAFTKDIEKVDRFFGITGRRKLAILEMRASVLFFRIPFYARSSR